MRWELSTWLALARAAQLLGALAAVAMHGYLTVEVFSKKLGLSNEMMALELLACLLLGYSILVLLVGHTGQRSTKTPWLTAIVIGDIILCGVLLGILTALARAGLPVHCAGMTRKDFTEGDKPNDPKFGFTTIRFSDESPGQRGELDRFCGLDRSYYTVATVLVFTYIFTITVTILRILEKKYTRNTKVTELLESLERADDIRLKVMDSPSPRDELPNVNLPPPPSEGIITRTTSLRSNFTAATSTAASHTGHYGPNSIPRRPVGNHAPPLPRRPLPPGSPTLHHATNPVLGFDHVPLDDDDTAEAALVADGMQHQPHHHHHQPHQSQPPYHHQRHPSRDHYSSLPRMPMLSEEEQSADAALVSDGMRPSEPTLPPYHPGNRRMSGHAEEDNEMRLSGYVKGQTRAQEMKDSGRY